MTAHKLPGPCVHEAELASRIES